MFAIIVDTLFVLISPNFQEKTDKYIESLAVGIISENVEEKTGDLSSTLKRKFMKAYKNGELLLKIGEGYTYSP